MSQESYAPMSQESYATPPPPPPPIGRREEERGFSLPVAKGHYLFLASVKGQLVKGQGPVRPLYRSLPSAAALYRGFPYSQSQGQPHVMASLGQSGQIVVKLMRVKVSNDRILIGLFGTTFDDSIGS